MSESVAIKKWYREFWAWFILSPLIVVVLVSSLTITLAVKGADDRVLENYYKEGRMINASFAEDARAVALGIELELLVDQELQTVLIDVLSEAKNGAKALLPERLRLEMLHPSDVDFDRDYVLTRIASNRYQSELFAEPINHKRYLRVSAEFDDGSASWRVRGEAYFSAALSYVRLQAK